jgi:hypothetical protein
MRGGVCKLLRSLAIACIPLTSRQIKTYHKTLEEMLRHPKESIQLDAKEALKEISKLYHPKNMKEANEFVKVLLKSAVDDEIVAVTKGYTMGIGSFCREVITENVLV